MNKRVGPKQFFQHLTNYMLSTYCRRYFEMSMMMLSFEANWHLALILQQAHGRVFEPLSVCATRYEQRGLEATDLKSNRYYHRLTVESAIVAN